MTSDGLAAPQAAPPPAGPFADSSRCFPITPQSLSYARRLGRESSQCSRSYACA